VPGSKTRLRPETVTVYSVPPVPLLPVGVIVTGLFDPLATIVPPLPAETPDRMDQSAPVIVAVDRLFEKMALTVQLPSDAGTIKSS
jgi:hypothetical protein